MPQPRPARHRVETALVAAILVMATAVLHYDVIFLGRSLIPSNFFNPIDYRPSAENYGPEMVPWSEWTDRHVLPYANIRDPGATWWQWEPGRRFLKEAIATGEWPFWDPNVGAGVPAMANLIPAFFFPPYLVVVALGAPPALLNAYFVLLLWGAAFLTYLFLRDHELTLWASLTGALAVLISGTQVQHAGTFIGQTASCMPLVMWATRRLVDSPTSARTLVLVGCYATSALASFPPLLVGIFGAAMLYFAVALFEHTTTPKRWAVARQWVIGASLSLGLVAFLYAPALAAKAATPQVAALYQYAGLETMPPLNLLQLLSPTLLGGVQTFAEPPVRLTGPFLPYVGAAVLFLAMLAPGRSGHVKERTVLVASGGVTMVILLKLVGAPMVQWVGGLPLLKEIHIAYYFGLPLGYLFIYLAAVGMQRLADGTVGAVRVAATAGALVLMVDVLWNVAQAQSDARASAVSYWVQDWRLLASASVVMGASATLCALSKGWRRTLALGAVILTVTAENGYNGWYPNPAAWEVFDHPPPYIRSLLSAIGNDRLFAVHSPQANLNSAFGIAGLGSLMAFNPPRVYEMYHQYSAPAPDIFMREARSLPPEGVLDRANIGVVSVNVAVPGIGQEAISRGYTAIYEDDLIALFRRPTLPRYRFTTMYQVVETTAALQAIARPDARTVVLEQQPPFTASDDRPDDPDIIVESRRKNSLTLLVDAPRAGLVYLAESYFDGWEARVNGQRVPVLPANYAFRAIAVPQGPVRIELRYWPPGLTAGLWISAASLAAVLGLRIGARHRTTLS